MMRPPIGAWRPSINGKTIPSPWGPFGLVAKIFPSGYTHGETDRFTDIGLDAQYQYIAGKHLISAESTWIHEKQDRDASFDLGDAAHHSDFLDHFPGQLNLLLSGALGGFGRNIRLFFYGRTERFPALSPARVSGSQNGKPDSNGFILEADYLPLEKVKVSLQYIIYDRFNGAHSNYDGFGRNASDNNTLYLSVWLLL